MSSTVFGCIRRYIGNAVWWKITPINQGADLVEEPILSTKPCALVLLEIPQRCQYLVKDKPAAADCDGVVDVPDFVLGPNIFSDNRLDRNQFSEDHLVCALRRAPLQGFPDAGIQLNAIQVDG